MKLRAPSPGFWIILLLPLMGVLLAAQAMFDSLVLWILYVVVGFVVFVLGVYTAARAKAVSAADEARLDELEPLPPTARDEEGRQ